MTREFVVHTATLTAHLLAPAGTRLPVPVEFSWNPLDPYAIRAEFGGDTPTTWVLARDLLVAGMTSTDWVGLGDVQTSRVDSEMGLMLDNGAHAALLFLPLPAVCAFLAPTMIATPLGDELVADEVLFGAALPTTSESI